MENFSNGKLNTRYWLHNIGYYCKIGFEERLSSFSMISLLVRHLWGRALASTCMVLRPITFKKQLILLLYPVFTVGKKVKWWSLLSALIIYCHYLQKLVASLKFVNTKLGNLSVNIKFHWGTCKLWQITLIIFWLRNFDFQINAS